MVEAPGRLTERAREAYAEAEREREVVDTQRRTEWQLRVLEQGTRAVLRVLADGEPVEVPDWRARSTAAGIGVVLLTDEAVEFEVDGVRLSWWEAAGLTVVGACEKCHEVMVSKVAPETLAGLGRAMAKLEAAPIHASCEDDEEWARTPADEVDPAERLKDAIEVYVHAVVRASLPPTPEDAFFAALTEEEN